MFYFSLSRFLTFRRFTPHARVYAVRFPIAFRSSAVGGEKVGVGDCGIRYRELLTMVLDSVPDR